MDILNNKSYNTLNNKTLNNIYGFINKFNINNYIIISLSYINDLSVKYIHNTNNKYNEFTLKKYPFIKISNIISYTEYNLLILPTILSFDITIDCKELNDTTVILTGFNVNNNKKNIIIENLTNSCYIPEDNYILNNLNSIFNSTFKNSDCKVYIDNNNVINNNIMYMSINDNKDINNGIIINNDKIKENLLLIRKKPNKTKDKKLIYTNKIKYYTELMNNKINNNTLKGYELILYTNKINKYNTKLKLLK